MSKTKILIVDDDQRMRDSLALVLAADGYAVSVCSNGKDAVEKIKDEIFDLVITDIRMPGLGGMELLEEVKKISPGTTVIMMTAYASIENVVEAMKKGAYDYIEKPFSFDMIKLKIARVVERQRLIKENEFLRSEVTGMYRLDNIIGRSPKMQEIFRYLQKIVRTDSTVLLTGESGTGKELVARYLHFNGPRKDRPFVAVNCAALAENLLESELFGHEKGAFTGAVARRIGKFEQAEGGTLFLDEISETSTGVQADLLRVLQEKEFVRVGGNRTIKCDVRIIAATHQDLEQRIKEGKFREDLYYRINVVPVHLPPLRERVEDIPLLVNFYLDYFNRKLNREIKKVAPEVINLFTRYEWPGNVRELMNIMERSVLLENTDTVTTEYLPAKMKDMIKEDEPVPEKYRSLKELEKFHILKTLDQNDWNFTQTANILEIDRKTLYNKIQRYGLSRKESRSGQEKV